MKVVLKAVFGMAVAGALLASSPAFAASRFGSLARWSGAERDEDGDVRVIAIYRDGAMGERALQRLARRFVGQMRRSFVHVPGDVLKVRPERLAEVLADLESDPDVLIAEPDRRDQHILGESVPWGIERIDADPGTRESNGAGDGAGVKVAVIDTGIWRSAGGQIHPDLAAVYKGGHDFVNNDSGPWDDNGHGTHVAGTIAAVDNDRDVVGVAPRVSLYALKSLGRDGYGYYSDFVEAVDWSIARKMQIINYSAGGSTYSASMAAACDRARAAGITIVAAAGNANSSSLIYPARFESVIAVGAVDDGDQRWNIGYQGSNYGTDLDLVAPGVNVESTWLGGGTVERTGTSMAAPHVTGVAALIAGRGVTDRVLIEDYLESTAQDLGNPGWDIYFGNGLVDAGAVLPAEPAIVAPLPGEIIPTGTPYTLQWDGIPAATSYRIYFASSATGKLTRIATVTGDDSLDWTAPRSKQNLPGCRFLIAAYDGAELIGVSTVAFSVEIVTIDAPAAGGEIVGGSLVDLAWSVGTPVRQVNKIVIHLSRDHGRTWKRLVRLGPATRSWQWQAPVQSVTRSDWRLRVRLLDRSGVAIGTDWISFNLVPPLAP